MLCYAVFYVFLYFAFFESFLVFALKQSNYFSVMTLIYFFACLLCGRSSQAFEGDREARAPPRKRRDEVPRDTAEGGQGDGRTASTDLIHCRRNPSRREGRERGEKKRQRKKKRKEIFVLPGLQEQMAEMQANKATNLVRHRDELSRRPQSTWFQVRSTQLSSCSNRRLLPL